MPDYGLRKNHEGYNDPTAHDGMSNVLREEKKLMRRVTLLTDVIRGVVELAGFDLLSGIEVRDKKTGRRFR